MVLGFLAFCQKSLQIISVQLDSLIFLFYCKPCPGRTTGAVPCAAVVGLLAVVLDAAVSPAGFVQGGAGDRDPNPAHPRAGESQTQPGAHQLGIWRRKNNFPFNSTQLNFITFIKSEQFHSLLPCNRLIKTSFLLHCILFSNVTDYLIYIIIYIIRNIFNRFAPCSNFLFLSSVVCGFACGVGVFLCAFFLSFFLQTLF